MLEIHLSVTAEQFGNALMTGSGVIIVVIFLWVLLKLAVWLR